MMNWHKRSVAASLLLLMATYFLPPSVWAQGQADSKSAIVSAQDKDSTQNKDNSQSNNSGQQLLAPPKVDLPHERTGVDSSKELKLSLSDAVAMALEHNLGIQVERENIKIAEYNLLAAMGVYDLLTNANINYNRSTFPTGSVLSGGGGATSVMTQTYTYDFGATQLLTTGGQLQATFNNTRTETSNTFSLLNPQYQPQVAFTFRQPLLKNFRLDQNQLNIRTLKKQLDISDLAFRQKLITLIATVQGAYYDLIFALRNEEIQREAVELAAVQLRNNQIQVRAGTAAPIDIVSAEAALEQRKDSAISALLAITQAENALKTLIFDDPNSDLWNSRVVPTEQVDFTPEPIDLTSALNIAMDRRPEIKQLELQGELNKINIEFLKNQEKPQVDLVAVFGGQGLAGQVRSSAAPPPGGGTSKAASVFSGGYGTALGNLFDFRTYQVGISFSFPLRNRTAKANLNKALVVDRQLDAQKRQVLQTVVTDVRNAVQAVESARQRVEAAHSAVLAAEAQLKGEEQKFAVGLSTNFFVLQRQSDLSVARGNELRAKTDYNKARADLQRVMANNVP